MGLLKQPVGDGITDDTEAIQALLDSGQHTVVLPEPEAFFVISRTLRIHSNTALVLGRFATIRLAGGANCHMLANAGPDDVNISVTGGIWDFNNRHQNPNPLRIPPAGTKQKPVLPFIFNFSHVRNLALRELTCKDPVVFAATFSDVEQFTVDDITFDFNYGNPDATNMDGIHLNGGCRFGRISNLKGACYDDLVALNADEGSGGPIEDIDIDGIFCEGCHSAVRLLSSAWPVRRVHIRNVFGTFFQYCVGVTRYYETGRIGDFDKIWLSGIYAGKAPRYPIYGKEGSYVFALIWVEGKLHVKNLQISQLHRRETVTAIPSVLVCKGTVVDNLSLEHVSQENQTGEPFPLIRNEGTIRKLFLSDVQVQEDAVLENAGTIEALYPDEDLQGRGV